MVVTLLIAATLLLTSCVHGMKAVPQGPPNNILFHKIHHYTNIEDIPGHKLVGKKRLDFSLARDIQTRHLEIIIENNYKTLKDLDLSFCQRILFEKIKLEQLNKLKKLEKVNLAYTKVTTPILEIISKNNPQLSHIDLSCCKKIKNWPSINWINCKNLRLLNLGNTNIEEDGFNNILKINHDITYLNIHACRHISLQTVFWQFFTKLESLSLGDTNITYDIINLIIENNKNLKHLDLRCCKNVNWLNVLWGSAKNLTTLCLSATDVTPGYLRKILKQAVNLKYVNVYGCNIQKKSLAIIKKDYQDCRIATDLSDKSWEIAARIAAGKEALIPKPSNDFVESCLAMLNKKKLKK